MHGRGGPVCRPGHAHLARGRVDEPHEERRRVHHLPHAAPPQVTGERGLILRTVSQPIRSTQTEGLEQSHVSIVWG
jgi:hypothetical protein